MSACWPSTTIWRRYDDSFVQALSVNAGRLRRGPLLSQLIATVNYEHRWRFDPFEFPYGVELNRRVYDGSVENTVTLRVGMLRKF